MSTFAEGSESSNGSSTGDSSCKPIGVVGGLAKYAVRLLGKRQPGTSAKGFGLSLTPLGVMAGLGLFSLLLLSARLVQTIRLKENGFLRVARGLNQRLAEWWRFWPY